MKNKKMVSRGRIIVFSCVLLVFLFLYLVFASYETYTLNSGVYRGANIAIIKNRMDLLFLEINDFPHDEGNDVLYLGKLRSLHRLINLESGVSKVFAKKDLAEDFLSFLEVNDVYYQLRYIDEDGMEIVRVDQGEDGPFIVEDEKSQNKKDRYYFRETMLLADEEIYVSRLDLNIEDGILENRGTKESPEYIPVIRYAMPVFDDNNVNKGIVVFNVFADYFLKDIRRFTRQGEFSFLLDNDGYYLAHPNRSKEFSFMFDGENSFDHDFPEVADTVLTGFGERTVETDDYIITFRHLFPTIGTFEIYQGSKKIFGEKSEEVYYWVLVSVSDKKALSSGIDSLRADSLVFILISAVLIFIVFILLLVILAMNGRMKK